MKKCLISVLLVSSLLGCTVSQRQNIHYADGWYTNYGIAHSAVAVVGTLISWKLFGDPLYGALLVCGFYIGHETHETRLWTRFEFGFWDSVFDVVGPCGVGASLIWILKR